MSPLFKYPVFVINLEAASRRMQHMEAQLAARKLPFTRINAILGKELPKPVIGFDEKRFHILTGKEGNPGEIGCYFSHLKALSVFLESGASHALILEDDVNLPPDLPYLLTLALQHQEKWDLLRLTSSRVGKFIEIARLGSSHRLAYNLKALKNTGAYFINRKAAAACVEKMLPMKLPFDVALDREWDLGFKTACIDPFPIELEPFEGQISKARRIIYYRATTFHIFHLWTHWQRKRIRTGYKL
jgi:glycosyl transferase, family 25